MYRMHSQASENQGLILKEEQSQVEAGSRESTEKVRDCRTR